VARKQRRSGEAALSRRGKHEAGSDILSGKAGKVGQDLVFTHAAGQVLESLSGHFRPNLPVFV
jgi:hypothetical protein